MTAFTAAANPPRLVRLGGRTWRVPGAALADLAELVAFVEDAVAAPAGAPCAPFSGDDAQEALLGAGLPLVFLLALQKCQRVSYEEAEVLALAAEPGETTALLGAFFRRKPAADDGSGGGRLRDLTEVAWGRQAYAVSERTGFTFPAIFALSLDQYDLLASAGKADDTWEGKELTMDQVLRIVGDTPETEAAADEPGPGADPRQGEIEAAMRRLDAAREAPPDA